MIKETTQQDLPAGFQTSEFLLERGLVDLIIPRGEMRDRMINLLKALYRAPKAQKLAKAASHMSAPADYNATRDYLYSLKDKGSKYGIDRMRLFVHALGHPERAFPIIHVAGTNGKGSTCSMLEAIYRANGYKTGLYSSPHLVRQGERVQVNREISRRGRHRRLHSAAQARRRTYRRRTIPTIIPLFSNS